MISFFSGGDFRHFYPENILNFATTPLAWDSSLNTGIGVSQLGSLWITSYFNFTLLFNKLGLSWNLISLLFWILPAIFLSFFSSFLLFKHLFSSEARLFAILSGIIYASNTYFLMILTGGQLGVVLGYSLAPLVLLRFIKIIEKPSLRNALISGLVLGLQFIFDPRIVYITLIAVFIYLLFSLKEIKKIKNKIFLLVPFVVSTFLNFFWILPLLLTKTSPIPQGFDSVAGFEFFSFSDFSKASSLLHPNFPENIFGKTYFLRPEFLILPILAFSSLLFKKRKEILYFAMLGLIGIFLAKGSNEPAGFINTWLFQNFPGMSIFRDPTKFYLLIALSYSILIPFSVYSVNEWVISKIKNQKLKIQSKYKIFNFSYVFLLFTILYLLFLIRPLWLGVHLEGSPRGEQKKLFAPKQVPNEYVEFKDFISAQPEFFRTLWIPQWQRFGYFSNNHPAIGREEIFKGDYKNQTEQVENSDAHQLLQDLSVKYIIVPFDSEEDFFLTERKYDDGLYQDAIARIEKLSWLKRVDGFEKPAIFEIENYKDHFWSPSTTFRLSYEYVNPTQYKVRVQNAQKGDLLVFSEGFDKNWTVESAKSRVKSEKFSERVNSFALPEDGDYDLRVFYEPQEWVNTGLIISGMTIVLALGLLGLEKMKK